MDNRVQQVSFIPKKPLVNKGYSNAPKKKKISLLSALGGAMMLCTALAFGGLFFWQMQVDAYTEKLQADLSSIRNQINDNAFTNFARVGLRIQTVEELLENHTAASILFGEIEEVTLKKTQLRSFDFSVVPSKTPVVDVELVTPSFDVLYRQAEEYKNKETILSAEVHDVSLDEFGNVAATITLVFDSNVGRYSSQYEETRSDNSAQNI